MTEININSNLSSAPINNHSNISNLPLPQFESLPYGTLRRYQAFFNLKNESGEVGNTKDEVLQMIKSHFLNFDLDS